MAQRIRDISPDISVHPVDEFIEPGQEEKLIPADADLVIDAIDAVAAKASLIAWCVANDKPVIACGAAGGRTDPLQLRVEDLSRTTGDALLSAVRARLRRHHGFPRGDGTAMPSSVSRAETSNVPAHSATQEGEGAPGHVPAQDVQPLRSAQTVPPSRRRRKGDPSRFGVPAIHSPEQIARRVRAAACRWRAPATVRSSPSPPAWAWLRPARPLRSCCAECHQGDGKRSVRHCGK